MNPLRLWKYFSHLTGRASWRRHTPAVNRRGTIQASLQDAAVPKLLRQRHRSDITWIATRLSLSPDAAGVGMDHRLSRAAAIRVGEFRHVTEHVVYAIPG